MGKHWRQQVVLRLCLDSKGLRNTPGGAQCMKSWGGGRDVLCGAGPVAFSFACWAPWASPWFLGPWRPRARTTRKAPYRSESTFQVGIMGRAWGLTQRLARETLGAEGRPGSPASGSKGSFGTVPSARGSLATQRDRNHSSTANWLRGQTSSLRGPHFPPLKMGAIVCLPGSLSGCKEA